MSDPFIGLLLKDRFIIRSYFTKGQFGTFYLANDMYDGEKQVMVKISLELEMNKKEYMILAHLNLLSKDALHFPHVYAGGEFIINTSEENNQKLNNY